MDHEELLWGCGWVDYCWRRNSERSRLSRPPEPRPRAEDGYGGCFFFPHLVDLRILILIYRLWFDGFRGCWIQHCRGDGEGVVTSFSPYHPRVFQKSPGALSPHQAVACLVPASPALSCT